MGSVSRNMPNQQPTAPAAVQRTGNRLIAQAQPGSGGASPPITPTKAEVLGATSNMLNEPQAQQAMQDFITAGAAAEAAQEQLAAGAGTIEVAFQQLLANEPIFRQLVEVYSTVRQLHHRAVLQELEQYGTVAATLPGFAYACLCEAVGQPCSKAPEDSVTFKELKKLHDMLPLVRDPLKPPQSLVQLAQDLFAAVSCGSCSHSSSAKPQLALLDDVKQLVLPDLLTLLLDSLAPAAAIAAGRQMPSTARWKQCQWVLVPDYASELAAKADRSRPIAYSSQWQLKNASKQQTPLITVELVNQLLQQAVDACSATPVRLHALDSLVAQLDMR